MVGLSNNELNKRVDEAVAYVKEHREVTNVLVSGGDAFMNPNHIVERYLRELTSIEHLDFIRFGSRVPVTLPERIYGDPEFLDMITKYAKDKTLYLVTQFNHPKGPAAQVVDHDLLRGPVVQAIGQRGAGRLIDDSHDVEARNFPRILGSLPLGVVEVGGDRDDRIRDRAAQIGLHE